jgi:hypothetical protein
VAAGGRTYDGAVRRIAAIALIGLVTPAACGSTGASPAPAPSTAATTTHASSTAPRKAGAKPAPKRRRTGRKALRPARRHGVPAVDMPNPALTPGAALTASRARVCTSGYASSVRDVPDSEKEAVYARYGVAHVPYQHEVDHLVSLEIGGSNAIANLWPEPYAGRWGARTKDVLENRLHDLVCSGRIGLRAAQRIEAANWVAAYRRYVGGTPSAPAPSGSSGSGAAGGSGGGGGGGCTPGYSPCLVDHGGADYDCAGGGGNGPYYTEPGVTYTVTGSDPYGLDGNGDGTACS